MNENINPPQGLADRYLASGTVNQVNPFIPTAKYADTGSTNPFFQDEEKRSVDFELLQQIKKGQAGLSYLGNDNYEFYQDRTTDVNAMGNLGAEYMVKYSPTSSKGWGEQNTYGRDAWLRYMKGESSTYFWNPQNMDDPSNIHNQSSYLSAVGEGIGKWFTNYEADSEFQAMKEKIATTDPAFTESVRLDKTAEFIEANPNVNRVLQAGGVNLYEYTRDTKNEAALRFGIHNAVIDSLQNIRLQKWNEQNQVFGSQFVDTLAYGIQDPLLVRDLAVTTALTLGLGTIEVGAARLAVGLGQTTAAAQRAMTVAKAASNVLQITSPFTGFIEGAAFKTLTSLGSTASKSATKIALSRALSIATESAIASGTVAFADQRKDYEWKNLLFQNRDVQFKPDWMQVGAATAAGFGAGGAMLGIMRFGLGAIGDIKYMAKGDWNGYAKNVAGSLDTWARTTDGLTVWGDRLSQGRGVLLGDLVDKYMSKAVDKRDFASILVNGSRLYATSVFSPHVTSKASFDEKSATKVATQFEQATGLPGEIVQQYPAHHPIRAMFDNLTDPEYLKRTGLSYDEASNIIRRFNERKSGLIGPVEAVESAATTKAISDVKVENSLKALSEIFDIDRISRRLQQQGIGFDRMNELHTTVTGRKINFGSETDRQNYRTLAKHEANGMGLAMKYLDNLRLVRAGEAAADFKMPDGTVIKGEVLRDSLRLALGLDRMVEGPDGKLVKDSTTQRLFITDAEDGEIPTFIISVEGDGTLNRHATTLKTDSEGRITIDSEITKAADYKAENIRTVTDMNDALVKMSQDVKKAVEEVKKAEADTKKAKLEKLAKTDSSVAESIKEIGKSPTRKVLKKHFNLTSEEAAMAEIVMETLGLDVTSSVLKIVEARGKRLEKLEKAGAKGSITWEQIESGIQALIRTTKHSDFGTLVHEMGHYNRMLFIGDTEEHKAFRNKIGITDDMWDKFKEWVGYDGEWKYTDITKEQRKAEEKFANAWAYYIRSVMSKDGKTNASGLHRLFSAMGDHLGDIGKKMESQKDLEVDLKFTDEAKAIFEKLFLRSEPQLTKLWQMAEKNVFKSLDAEARARLGESILGEELWKSYRASINNSVVKERAKTTGVITKKEKRVPIADRIDSIKAKITGEAFSPSKKAVKEALNAGMTEEQILARVAELRANITKLPDSPNRPAGDPMYFASHVENLTDTQLSALVEGTTLDPIPGVVRFIYDEKTKTLDVAFPVIRVSKELIEKELKRRKSRADALKRLAEAKAKAKTATDSAAAALATAEKAKVPEPAPVETARPRTVADIEHLLSKPVLPDFTSAFEAKRLTDMDERFRQAGEIDASDPELLKLIEQVRQERTATGDTTVDTSTKNIGIGTDGKELIFYHGSLGPIGEWRPDKVGLFLSTDRVVAQRFGEVYESKINLKESETLILDPKTVERESIPFFSIPSTLLPDDVIAATKAAILEQPLLKGAYVDDIDTAVAFPIDAVAAGAKRLGYKGLLVKGVTEVDPRLPAADQLVVFDKKSIIPIEGVNTLRFNETEALIDRALSEAPSEIPTREEFINSITAIVEESGGLRYIFGEVTASIESAFISRVEEVAAKLDDLAPEREALDEAAVKQIEASIEENEALRDVEATEIKRPEELEETTPEQAVQDVRETSDERFVDNSGNPVPELTAEEKIHAISAQQLANDAAAVQTAIVETMLNAVDETVPVERIVQPIESVAPSVINVEARVTAPINETVAEAVRTRRNLRTRTKKLQEMIPAERHAEVEQIAEAVASGAPSAKNLLRNFLMNNIEDEQLADIITRFVELRARYVASNTVLVRMGFVQEYQVNRYSALPEDLRIALREDDDMDRLVWSWIDPKKQIALRKPKDSHTPSERIAYEDALSEIENNGKLIKKIMEKYGLDKFAFESYFEYVIAVQRGLMKIADEDDKEIVKKYKGLFDEYNLTLEKLKEDPANEELLSFVKKNKRDVGYYVAASERIENRALTGFSMSSKKDKDNSLISLTKEILEEEKAEVKPIISLAESVTTMGESRAISAGLDPSVNRGIVALGIADMFTLGTAEKPSKNLPFVKEARGIVTKPLEGKFYGLNGVRQMALILTHDILTNGAADFVSSKLSGALEYMEKTYDSPNKLSNKAIEVGFAKANDNPFLYNSIFAMLMNSTEPVTNMFMKELSKADTDIAFLEGVVSINNKSKTGKIAQPLKQAPLTERRLAYMLYKNQNFIKAIDRISSKHGISGQDVLARIYGSSKSGKGIASWFIEKLELPADSKLEDVLVAAMKWGDKEITSKKINGSVNLIAERLSTDQTRTTRGKGTLSGDDTLGESEGAGIFLGVSEDLRNRKAEVGASSFIEAIQSLFYEYVKDVKIGNDEISLGDYFVARLKAGQEAKDDQIKLTVQKIEEITGFKLSIDQADRREKRLTKYLDDFFSDLLDSDSLDADTKKVVLTFKEERLGLGKPKRSAGDELNQAKIEEDVAIELRSVVYSDESPTLRTVIEVLGSTDSEYASLAREMLEISSRDLNEIGVYPVRSKIGAMAYWDPNLMSVLFRDSKTSNFKGKIVVHEAFHAITNRYIADLEGRAMPDMNKNYTGQAYVDGLQSYIQAQKKTKKYSAEVELIEAYLEAIDSGEFKFAVEYINSGNDEKIGTYGLMDLHEFVSEAMTNKDFATKLAGINSKTKADRSLLNKLFDALINLTGLNKIKNVSLLEKVAMATETIAKTDKFSDMEAETNFLRQAVGMSALDEETGNQIRKAMEADRQTMDMLIKTLNDMSASKGRLKKGFEEDELFQQSKEFLNSEFERGLTAERYLYRRFQSDQLSSIKRGETNDPELKEFLNDWGNSLVKMFIVEDEKISPPVLKKLENGEYEYGSGDLVFNYAKAVMKRLLFNRYGEFLKTLAELSPEERSKQAGEMLSFLQSDEKITPEQLSEYDLSYTLYQSATPDLIDAVDLRRRKLAEYGLHEELTEEDLVQIQRILNGLSPVDMETDKIFSNITSEFKTSSLTTPKKDYVGTNYRELSTEQRRDFVVNTLIPKIREAMGDRNNSAGMYSTASNSTVGKKVNALIGGAANYGDTADSNSVFIQFISKIFDPMMDMRDGELKNKWNVPSVDKLNAEVNNILLRSNLIQTQNKILARVKDPGELQKIMDTAWLYLTRPADVPSGPNKDLIIDLINARNEFNKITVELLSNFGNLSKKTDPNQYGTSHIASQYAKQNQKEFSDALTAHAVKKTIEENKISVITAEALGWLTIKRDHATEEIVSVKIEADSPLAKLLDEKKVGKKLAWKADVKKIFDDVNLLDKETQDIHRKALTTNENYTDTWKQAYASKGPEFTAIRQSMEIAKNRYLGLDFADSKSGNPRRVSIGEGRNYTEERIISHDEITRDPQLSRFFSSDILDLSHNELRGTITDAVMTKYLSEFFGTRMSMSDLLQILATNAEEFKGRSHLSAKEIESRQRGYERLRNAWNHSIGNWMSAYDSMDENYKAVLDSSRQLTVLASGLRAALMSVPETGRALLTSNKNRPMIMQLLPNLVKMVKLVGPGGKNRRLARQQMVSASHWLRGIATDHMLHRNGIHPENPFQGVVFGQGAGGMFGNFVNAWRTAGVKNATETSTLRKALNRTAAFAAAAEAPLAFVNDMTTTLHIWNAQENLTTNINAFRKMALTLEKNPAADYSEFASFAKRCGLAPKEALDLNSAGLLKTKTIDILAKAVQDKNLYTDGLIDVRKMYIWAGEDADKIDAINTLGGYINMTARHTNVEPTLLDIRVNQSLFGKAMSHYMQFLLSMGVQEIGRRRRTQATGYSQHLAGLVIMEITAYGIARSLSDPGDDEKGGYDEFVNNPMDYIVRTATSIPLLGSYAFLGNLTRHAIMGVSDYMGGPGSEQQFRTPDLFSSPSATSPRRLLNTPEVVKSWYNEGHEILTELLAD